MPKNGLSSSDIPDPEGGGSLLHHTLALASPWIGMWSNQPNKWSPDRSVHNNLGWMPAILHALWFLEDSNVRLVFESHTARRPLESDDINNIGHGCSVVVWGPLLRLIDGVSVLASRG